MDVHQVIGGLTQLGHGGGSAIDPGAALALQVDAAPQQQGLASLETGLIEPAQQAGRHIELGTDVGPQCTFAHDTHVTAAAQCELQGVDQDRLASAGLTGEDREAGVEVQLERRHDGEITQGQSAQHAQATPSYQRNLRRKVAK